MQKNSFDIAEYFNRINIFLTATLSPNGKMLAYQSSVTGSPQVWIGKMPVGEGLLEYPVPLTNKKDEQPHVMMMDSQGTEWVSDERILLMMDRHGDEQTFLLDHDFKSGETVEVPRGDGRDYLGFCDSAKKVHYFSSNRGHAQSQGLFAYDLKTREVRELYCHPEQTSHWMGNFAVKGGYLFGRSMATNSNTLHAINPKTKQVTDLFVEPRTSIFPLAVFSDKEVLVATNHGRQFLSLAKFNVVDRSIEYLGPDKWDVHSGEMCGKGKHLLITRNVAGRSEFELYAWPSMKKMNLKFKSEGVIDSLHMSKDGSCAVFTYVTPTSPRDIYRLDFKTKKVHALTNNWTSRIPRKNLSMPKLVQYPSQGKKIYSWLFLPKGAKRDRRLPVVIWPHGGPQAQEKAGFRPILQYLVGREFVVWAPNPTGSTGFGKDFTDAIAGQWGTADLPDMENGIKWLKESGWIDQEKIMIMGGSYGGYMTLRTLTKIPGTFKAGVDIFGVSNLLTFVKTVPSDWTPYMDKLVGNPERDKEKLTEQSPIFSLDKIDCPLMVVQGALDPRVVKAESDQVVDTLKKHGTEVEYLVFEDEGHGFFKLENELKAYKAIAGFLERHV